MARRIEVWKGDTIVIGDYSVSADVLEAILTPSARLLWAFLEKDGRIQPVAFDESKVIWLEDSDYSSPELVGKT